jgi:hypothetical protein
MSMTNAAEANLLNLLFLNVDWANIGDTAGLQNSAAAGAAGNPLLGIVEGTLTLRDVMRLLLAVNAGDAAGLEGNTMSFRSQDGTIIRVQASYTSGSRSITTVDPT